MFFPLELLRIGLFAAPLAARTFAQNLIFSLMKYSGREWDAIL